MPLSFSRKTSSIATSLNTARQSPRSLTCVILLVQIRSRPAKPTVQFIDEYCQWYQALFLEVGSFEALLIIQSFWPDLFFSAIQQARLSKRMSLWRAARDRRETLPPDQEAELEALVDAELRAATAQTAALTSE